jgi:hypothetical protein
MCPSLYLSHDHQYEKVISFRLVRRHVTISQNSQSYFLSIVTTCNACLQCECIYVAFCSLSALLLTDLTVIFKTSCR